MLKVFFRCVNRNSWSGGHFIQNIVFGQSEQCPEGIVISEELSDGESTVWWSITQTTLVS